MSKVKRIFFFLFVLGSLSAGVWAYLNFKKIKSPSNDALSLIPDSCLIYLNTNDFLDLSKKFNSQSLIIDNLKFFESIHATSQLLQSFDTIFSPNVVLKDVLINNKIHFALYNNCSSWIINFNLKQLGDEEKILEQFKIVLKNAKAENNYLKFELKKKQYYFKIYDGIVLVSNDVKIINEALDKNSSKFISSKEYENFKTNLSENNFCNIYFNSNFINQGSSENKIPFLEIKNLFCGSFELSPSDTKINGLMKFDSSQICSSLANQEPQQVSTLIAYMPSSTNYFEAYGFSSFLKTRENLKSAFKNHASNYWKGINKNAMYNLEKEFYENINGHLAQFEAGNSLQRNVGALFLVNDSTQAIKHLKLMSDSNYTKNELLIFKFNSQESKNLFYPFINLNNAFMTCLGNAVYIEDTEESLLEIANSILTKNNLESNLNFMHYRAEHVLNEFNYMIYSSPRANADKINSLFLNGQQPITNPYESLGHFSFVLSNNASNFKFRMHLLNQNEHAAATENILWACKLDTVCISKPYAFVNHKTGENEICIQDVNNNLYLINAKGKIIWQKEINEKIASPIYMVDAFQNNKNQLLFNTSNYLHLIDRNGNYVEGFPFKLPAETKAPLTLFDYKGDKDYRIFISCTNHFIYNYNVLAELVDGFEPVKTENDITIPIKYNSIGANDYLTAMDCEGKIYIFGRKGQQRISLKNRTIQNCKAFEMYTTNSLANSYLIYYDDKNSLINKVFLIDKKDVVKLNIEPNAAFTDFCLVDDNRDNDLIIVRDKQISAFNYNGDNLYSIDLACNSKGALHFDNENTKVLCVLNDQERNLEIIDLVARKNKIVNANTLPLIMNLFNDNKNYFLVPNGNQLNCMPLNQ